MHRTQATEGWVGSLDLTGAEDYFPRVAGFDPAVTPAFTVAPDGSVHANSSGSTDQILPGSRGDEIRLQAKLTTFLPGGAKLTGTYLFSRHQQEDFEIALHKRSIPNGCLP